MDKVMQFKIKSGGCCAIIKFRETPNPNFKEYCEEIYRLLASYYKLDKKEA